MKATKKVLALGLALAMVVTAVPVTSAEAATTKLSATKATLFVGGPSKVLKVTPAAKVTSATSDDTSIAKVKYASNRVRVYAVSAGTAKVTVKAGKKTLKANVTVKNSSARITADGKTVKSLTLTEGETKQLSVLTYPASAGVKKYTTSNPAVVTFENGVLTAVGAGKAKIAAYSNYGVKKTAIVTVKAATAQLSSVKQTASNAFTATFTADASKTITKDDITVKTADDTMELAVKSVKYSEDGLSAEVTVFGNFVNATTYKVAAKDVTRDLNAIVGEVARVQIDTDTAQQNVETKIEFRLFDADGIDVTPSVSLDSTCTVNVDGSYSAASLDKASAATVTMNTVNDKVDVTVVYNNNANGAQDVTGIGTITCVDAKASLGTKLFASTTKTNNNSHCAKFYLGLSDSTVYVSEAGYNNNVFFCAKDSTGDVISYDSYEVESANDDIASASLTKDSGKFAQISVAGNTVGNTQLNVKATKNGKDTYYTIPVVVTKVGELASMTVNVTLPTISNVDDSDYTGKIEVNLFDKDNNEISGNVSAEIITTVTSGTALNFGGQSIATAVDSGAWNKAEIVYNAQNAVEKTYTIKVTGADSTTGKTITRNVSVNVKDLMGKVAKAGVAGLKLTYQISISNNIDENPADTWDDSMKASLYATYNGLFAGYVREDSGDFKVANGNVKPATRIDNVEIGAKFGTKVFSPTNGLYSAANYETIPSTYQAKFSAVDSSDSTVEWKADGTSADLAKVGTYTLVYKLTEDGATKAKEITKVFTVKNNVVIPTVTVTSRTADTLNRDDIVKCLKTNVDMNHDTSDHVSISDLVGTGTSGALVESNNKVTVKNAVVDDNYGNTTWKFYVPVNATFKTE